MMKIHPNGFKRALAERRRQLGLWCTLPGTVPAEIAAGAGYDWLLFDTEHAPMDPLTILPQLQTSAAYPSVASVVRPAANDPVLIKRMLDIGAQSLLIPYVENLEQATAALASMTYPPDGVRGVGGAHRASRYGQVKDYIRIAEQELCLLVQVETTAALGNIEDIASLERLDGIFVGPADLAASMGHRGRPGHPEVVAAVEDAIIRIVKAGKPAGILTTDPGFARRCLALGAVFVAVGVDTPMLASALDERRQLFA